MIDYRVGLTLAGMLEVEISIYCLHYLELPRLLCLR